MAWRMPALDGEFSTSLWISCDKDVGLRRQSPQTRRGNRAFVAPDRKSRGVGGPAIEPLERVVEPLPIADQACPNVRQIVDGLVADVDAVRPDGTRGSPPAGGAKRALLVFVHGGECDARSLQVRE